MDGTGRDGDEGQVSEEVVPTPTEEGVNVPLGEDTHWGGNRKVEF